ncbi:MAG: cobalt-precorrin-4/precorrin-4 C(11)-methyltransferase [Desulfonauticus sp.]|nr:cobalt-precorrin-4/precorrin-4 C(11)-methyltransferase [Desulfonauticus sp.]
MLRLLKNIFSKKSFFSSSFYPVYFVGAGPGDPELLTVKAKKLIDEADFIVYTGSLVPENLFLSSKARRKIDSSNLDLEEIVNLLFEGYKKHQLVVRVHTGDPLLYGAVWEQLKELDKLNVPYQIVPGITTAFALAAEAKISFTLPKANQTLIFTRVSGTTIVPDSQSLERLARSKSAFAIYLSARQTEKIYQAFVQAGYDENSQVVIGYRVGWPDQEICLTTLKDFPTTFQKLNKTRQVLFLILPTQEGEYSYLYSKV